MKKLRKNSFTTISGLDVAEVYGLNGSQQRLERPGEYPYTRGIRETMYRGKLWTMRQYAGFGTAEESNERYHYLLKSGITGLSVAFDLPTQMGRDSDHKRARGEVGKVGVAISTAEDMALLLRGIPLDQVSISMTINSTAAILLSFLLIVADEQGVSWDKLRGTIQNDMLKEYIARGTYIYPPNPAIRIITDIFSFCQQNVREWNTISISGYHIREAGSTAVDEIAFTLANAICYVEAAIKAGLSVDSFAPRLAFFFNCHNDFLEEVSKFRAARRLWAKIMKERFGAKDPKSLMLRFHTQTAGSSLTAQQPLNNIVRTTVQAMAAVFGGTQSLHTNSFDEALGLPTEESAQIALRTQQILAEESGVANSVDPLGGSFLIEEWTDRLEQQAKERIEYIDRLGGMLEAIEQGYPQECIEKSAYEFQRQVEDKEYRVVGVNSYQVENETPPEILAPSPKGEQQQIERVRKFKQNRNKAAVQEALARLKSACQNTEQNIVEAILSASRAKATLGEMSDVMREEFGEYGG